MRKSRFTELTAFAREVQPSAGIISVRSFQIVGAEHSLRPRDDRPRKPDDLACQKVAFCHDLRQGAAVDEAGKKGTIEAVTGGSRIDDPGSGPLSLQLSAPNWQPAAVILAATDCAVRSPNRAISLPTEGSAMSASSQSFATACRASATEVQSFGR